MKKLIFVVSFGLLTLCTSGQSGTLNSGFGIKGVVKTVPSTNVAGSTFFASTRTCFTQTNGRILVLVDLGGSAVVSRRLVTGRPDSSYGTNGFSVPVAIANPVGLLQPDGKFAVAGFSNNGPQDLIIARFNSNGTLDGSFGNNGVMLTDAGSTSDAVTALAIQPDGRIIGGVATFRSNMSVFALIRYTTSGKPDPTFGTGGLVISAFDNPASVTSVVVQADGRIVAGGTYNNGSGNFAVARYKTNGYPDTSFDHTGFLVFSSGNSDNVSSLALQSGKILLGGSYDDQSGSSVFEVARVTGSGSIDLSFGQNGFANTNFGAFGTQEALAVQPNGSVISAGYLEPGGSNAIFALARFTAAGKPDSSFGTYGQVQTVLSDTSSDFLGCLSVAPNGQILAGGSSVPSTFFFNKFSLVRYNNNGSLDVGFAASGILVAEFPDQDLAYSQIFLEPDGKLLVPGQLVQGSNSENFISRFTAKGTLDPSYGTQGSAGTSGFYNIMQQDGRVVVSGDTILNGLSSLLLRRYNTTGSVDPTFGTNGVAAINFFGENESGSNMAMQPDQKIIASGFISNDGDNDILLARFNANGTPDLSFGSEGAVSAGFEEFSNVQSIAVGANGKILVAGTGFNASFQLIAYIARFNPNGNVDSSFGLNGAVLLPAGLESFAGTVIPLASGKVLFDYEASADFITFNSFMTRYNINGTVDSSFGVSGTIPVSGGGIITEPDQKIIAMGHVRDPEGNEEFVISRYLSNGKPDMGFGTKGTTESNLSPIFDNMASAVVTGTNLALAGSAQDPSEIGLLAEYILGPQLSTGTASITLVTDPGSCTATLKELAEKIAIPDGITPTVSGSTTSRFSGTLAAFPFNKGVTRLLYYPGGDSSLRQETIIEVVDREAPMIGSIGNSFSDHPDADGWVTLQLAYSATDNCGSVRTKISTDGLSSAPLGDHSLRFKPGDAGMLIFSVVATDESGNRSERADSIMIPESLFHSINALMVTATPNPASGEFILQVRASNQSLPVTLELYSALGTSLQTPIRTMPGQTTRMGAGLPAGTYVLKALQGSNFKIIKLLKR